MWKAAAVAAGDSAQALADFAKTVGDEPQQNRLLRLQTAHDLHDVDVVARDGVQRAPTSNIVFMKTRGR